MIESIGGGSRPGAIARSIGALRSAARSPAPRENREPNQDNPSGPIAIIRATAQRTSTCLVRRRVVAGQLEIEGDRRRIDRRAGDVNGELAVVASRRQPSVQIHRSPPSGDGQTAYGALTREPRSS